MSDSTMPAALTPSEERAQRIEQRRSTENTRRRELIQQLTAQRMKRHAENTIQYGSLVLVYESNMRIVPCTVTRNATLNNRFGSFAHSSFVGRPFGCRIQALQTNAAKAKAAKATNASAAAAVDQRTGWLVLLRPTASLWTLALSHRTQILYQQDISLVLLLLDCQSGSVVFESGTGSGSLTTAFANAVGDAGHVYTFEFNADRCEKARDDFKKLGIEDRVTVTHRNVCEFGFPLVEGGVSCLFLDLPTPWIAVESAYAALHTGGRLCSFSPCIEQVQRTCAKLAEKGRFTQIRTFEVLQREMDVTRIYQTQPKPSWNGSASSNIKSQSNGSSLLGKRHREESESDERQSNVKQDETTADAEPSADSAITAQPVNVSSASASAPTFISRAFGLMRGHTGFLTFATCLKQDKID